MPRAWGQHRPAPPPSHPATQPPSYSSAAPTRQQRLPALQADLPWCRLPSSHHHPQGSTHRGRVLITTGPTAAAALPWPAAMPAPPAKTSVRTPAPPLGCRQAQAAAAALLGGWAAGWLAGWRVAAYVASPSIVAAVALRRAAGTASARTLARQAAPGGGTGRWGSQTVSRTWSDGLPIDLQYGISHHHPRLLPAALPCTPSSHSSPLHHLNPPAPNPRASQQPPCWAN
jgi:hypothetical protein